MAATVQSVASTAGGARSLPFQRTLAITSTKFLSRWVSSKMDFNFLQLGCRKNTTLPARKLLIRAARTESQGVFLGFRPPNFELPEPLTGKTWKLDDFESYPALLVMFICNHCPFVIHLKKDIVKLTNFYMKKGLAVIAISSNSVATHPQNCSSQDGPDFMAEEAKLRNYSFPYLYDESRSRSKEVKVERHFFKSQEVARDFGAVCTPEFFLFKKDGRRPFELVYHGQFDDSRPSNNVPITGRDLSLAIDCVLTGQPVSSIQKPSIGCSIKWHPGAGM
ncbi:uncharacterized protein LOC105629143 isoform X9 [Jatropha curcas]|uniref:uncharacterized protein LOC105629143 isoform X9 n=1 Tax=Jatropha curcas TaxID=180498 RepID=UPI001894EAC8|nr:uncharacterized protein LOC105629143 isoform X9 [Jatropha curcas]XP_037493436.1 uncharacterized protein LOC105629143 isoform X9 [Jatropha curcas]